jgi:glutamine amidotransferase-like uncharacterized protein
LGVSNDCLKHTQLFINKRVYRSKIKIVDAKFLQHNGWLDEAKILIIPGGADRFYNQMLQGVGCTNIKKFVEIGGTYLGICAGGYFGSAKVEFALGTEIEVNEERELSFFPGTATGPVLKNYVYNSKEGALPAELSRQNGDCFYSYYNGGCTFKDAELFRNVEVIAKYKDANNCPAIVRCKYGKGLAILSGVHFEYDLELLKQQNIAATLIKALRKSGPTINQVLDELFATSCIQEL